MENILTRLQNWYSASPTKRYSTAALREEAVKCLAYHTHEEVSKAIGKSVATLKAWQKSLSCEQGAINRSSEFVAITLDNVNDINETNQLPLSLRVNLPSGLVIDVKSADMDSLVKFIVALNKESNPCSI